ncbi:hypothetical protein [Streptomyces sp. NPDC051214]|uniref:hypothetical protein n=1 Tax=Streptomyces sp. NPDC051214 TaxID=3155282 RepID=UPI0034498DDF
MNALRERAERLPPGWTMYTSASGEGLLPAGFAKRGIEEFDAIAVGPGGGVIFEIVQQKSADSQMKIDRINSIRARLRGIEGWDVEVIVLAQPDILARKDEIDRRLRTVTDLAKFGESSGNQEVLRAAFVLAFSGLEWTLAQHFQGEENRRPQSVRQMAERLVSEGLLSEATYREIRELNRIRNEIVHGLSVAKQVDAATIHRIAELTEDVYEESANGRLEGRHLT